MSHVFRILRPRPGDYVTITCATDESLVLVVSRNCTSASTVPEGTRIVHRAVPGFDQPISGVPFGQTAEIIPFPQPSGPTTGLCALEARIAQTNG